MKKADQQAIVETLRREYAGARPALRFSSPYQLLLAVMLSAQSTDEQVNRITERLFAECPGPEEIAALSQAELEDYVHACGLYKNKAKNILAATRILLEQYGGLVPSEREALESLPGVGRKTANVVLSVAFGVPALAVDTHVFRVAHRLGLSAGSTPEKVEQDLCAVFAEEDWADAHHWLIWHGRRVCTARKPKCEICALAFCCPGRSAGEEGGKA